MHKRRKAPVERYHDRVAAKYDHSYDDVFWQWHDAITWEHIKPHLPVNQRAPVADLGCGTGKWAAKLAKSGYSVTCIDVSAKMVDQARTKLGDTRADFTQADLCDLSAVPAGRFALALALGDPIGCTTFPPKALKEIRRILAPGGLLIATFDNRLSALEFYVRTGDPKQMADFLRSGKTHWLTRDADEQFPIHTYTPAQLRRLFDNAGFETIDLIGKMVLPLRRRRELLADSAARRAWMKIEQSLHRDESALGLASHLQIVARVRGDETSAT